MTDGQAPESRSGARKRRIAALLAVACLALAGGAVAIIVGMMKSSPAYRVSEEFIRRNDEIRALVGGEMKFGLVPRGSISPGAEEADAEFDIRVRGPAGRTEVKVFSHTAGREWKVLSASYRDRDGSVKTILPRAVGADPVLAEHMVRAYRYYGEENFPAAIAEYTRVVEADPNNSAAYYWRGVSLAKSGADDRAIADLQRSIALDARRVEAYEYLDWLLARRGQWSAIAWYWSALLELEPGNARACYQRAAARWRAGDRAGALEDARRACRLGLQDGCRAVRRFK